MTNNLRELRKATEYAIKKTSEKHPLTLGQFKSILDLAIKIREDSDERRFRNEEESHRQALEAAFDY